MDNSYIHRAIEYQIDSGVSPQDVLGVLRRNPLLAPHLGLTTHEEDMKFLKYAKDYANKLRKGQ